MIRNTFFSFFVFMSIFSFAQFSVEFSGGYAVPFSGGHQPFSQKKGIPFFPYYTWYRDYSSPYYGEYYVHEKTNYHLENTVVGYYVLNSGLNINTFFSYQIYPWFRVGLGVFYLNNKYLGYQKRGNKYILTNDFWQYYTLGSDDINKQYSTYIHLKSHISQIVPLLCLEFNKSIKKATISFFYSQGFSFLTLTKEKQYIYHDAYSRLNIFTLEKYYNKQWTYQLGLKFSYKLTESLSLITSVTFFEENFMPDKGEVVFRKENTWINGKANTVESDEVQTIQINALSMHTGGYSGNAINYTVGLRYSFGKKTPSQAE